MAQVAIQGGRYAADQIVRRLKGQEPKGPFEYFDKGSMATISRFSAVASVGKAQFSGFFAWILWLAVHLVYIIGFKHRITTLLHWVVTFIGRGRSERVVTEQQVFARQAIADLGTEHAPRLPRLAKDRPHEHERPGRRPGDGADRPRPDGRLTDGHSTRPRSSTHSHGWRVANWHSTRESGAVRRRRARRHVPRRGSAATTWSLALPRSEP